MKKEFSIKMDGCFTIAKAYRSTNGKSFISYEIWANIFVPQMEDYTNFLLYRGKTYNKAYSVFRTLVNSRKELK